jgi:magnesium transporter
MPAEVDFFIKDNLLITLHDNKLIGLKELLTQCTQYEYYRDLNMGTHPNYFFYIILEKLLQNCFPMLDHIATDNQRIENNIFKNREREMVKEILIVKRNIVNFRFIMQSHRTIIKKFIELDNKYLSMNTHKIFFEKLLVQTKDIWEVLEGHKQTIDALHETNESAISFRINDVMKTLTLISVIFLPLTLISSVFGMNVNSMPFMNEPTGFWMIIAILGLLFILMLFFFKSKKWF